MPGTIAVGMCFKPFEPVEAGRWLGGDALHLRQVPLQAPRRAHESAAGAQAGDEVRDAPVGLLDDLRTGGFEVRLPVGGLLYWSG